MSKPEKTPSVQITKSVYAMESSNGQDAEITMYGDIYEQRPVNWDGKPVEGTFILLSEFLKDLERLSRCQSITIRMNSYGGDAGASNTIHNRLRELARKGVRLTCSVDGAAMSGGSLIMCACDTVKVNPSSLIMIHKCWQMLWGGYNADELREQAAQQDAWDKMQAEIYQRKTGLPAEEIVRMMAETTYLTGREAAEKGFADELIADAEPTEIAASADRRSLFVRGRQFHLTPGMFAPDSIPTASEQTKNEPEKTGGKGEIPMTNEKNEAVCAAVQAERARMQEIDEISCLLDAASVQEAKYGEHPCTAAELLMNAAKKAAKEGRNFLAALEEDGGKSGTSDIPPAAPEQEETAAQTPEERLAHARAEVQALFHSKEG